MARGTSWQCPASMTFQQQWQHSHLSRVRPTQQMSPASVRACTVAQAEHCSSLPSHPSGCPVPGQWLQILTVHPQVYLFNILKKYLFYLLPWLLPVLVAARRIFDFHWGMQSLLVIACGIFICGMWGLIPWPGIELGPPALGAWSLSHWATREVPPSI